MSLLLRVQAWVVCGQERVWEATVGGGGREEGRDDLDLGGLGAGQGAACSRPGLGGGE